VASKLNQATAIAVTPDENIVVAGTSANASGDLDYQLFKYSPNGDEIWRARYDLADGHVFDDQLRGMTIDPAGNVIVTGTTAMVKFAGADGKKLWEQPLGGRAVVANASYVYVTGFSDVDFATAQLTNNNTYGALEWTRTYNGQLNDLDASTAIGLASNGEPIIGGWETTYRSPRNQGNSYVFTAIRYRTDGSERWRSQSNVNQGVYADVRSLVLDADENVYLYGIMSFEPVVLRKFNSDGTFAWGRRVPINDGRAAVVTSDQSIVCSSADTAVYLTKYSQTNSQIWQNLYSPPTIQDLGGVLALVAGHSNEIYAAGYIATATSKDVFLIKVDGEGVKLSSVSFNGRNSLDDIASAMILDTTGSVYLTGYSTTPEGGSEFLTLKFSAIPKIEAKADGIVHLEFPTSPGQQYAIEGSTDFLNWQSLITNTADGSGLVKFDDTNAVTIPYRFYRGKQP
jgi:hypothetical protein